MVFSVWSRWWGTLMSITISSTDLQVILTLFRAFNFVLSVLLSTWHWRQQFYKDITASCSTNLSQALISSFLKVLELSILSSNLQRKYFQGQKCLKTGLPNLARPSGVAGRVGKAGNPITVPSHLPVRGFIILQSGGPSFSTKKQSAAAFRAESAALQFL